MLNLDIFYIHNMWNLDKKIYICSTYGVPAMFNL